MVPKQLTQASEGRQLLPPALRRSQLIDAAVAAFSEQGYEATRISDIVRRAGVAQGTFYLHFASKEAIYLAITESVTDAMFNATVDAVARTKTLAEAIEAGVHTSFAQMSENRTVLSLIIRSPLLTEVREQTRRLGDTALRAMAGRLREAAQRGEIATDIDPDIAVRLVHGAINYVLHCYLDATPRLRRKVEAETLAFAKRSLGLQSTPTRTALVRTRRKK